MIDKGNEIEWQGNNDPAYIKKLMDEWTKQCIAKEKEMSDFDNVKKPKHYNREGGIESIEEMEIIFGPEVVMHFCLCNVWKYRYRAADKNGEEDLRKSDWYMNKYLELKEKVKRPLNASYITTMDNNIKLL